MRVIRSANILSILLSLSLSYPVKGVATQHATCTSDPSSALAFVGTLTELTPAATAPPGWKSATFHVSELLQGQTSDAVSVLMRADLCRDSGPTPTVGAPYLVQTHISPNGSVYQLEQCEQVRPLDQVSTALEYLRSSQKGATPTEVLGEARVETRGYPWKRIPLPRTTIHLVGSSNQQIDFLSDEDGRFHGTLKPGKYAITADFPTGYAVDSCGTSVVNVAEHRCTEVAVCAHPTASITAHIVDVEGDELGPLSNVQLTLEAAEDQQFVLSVWPDEKSDLHADNLLPGRYILGLNTYLPVSRGSAPYPPIYYPGVSGRSDAQVLTLGTL